MKRKNKIRSVLVTVSVYAFVASYAIFIISLLLKCYDNVIWSGMTSLVSFTIIVIIAKPDNDAYLDYLRRHGRL